MTTSPTVAELFAALAEAQGHFPSAAKDAVNPHFGHNYATLAGHVEAAKPHLKAQGLAVLQDVVTNTAAEGVDITTRIVHRSGEWVEFGPLFVPASKWDAQGLGSAITYGRRYQFGAAVGTVPDDDDANDAVKTTPVKAAPVPATVVDTRTGAEVPFAEASLPPAGYFYVANYKLSSGGWHEASLLAYDAQGGALKVSTKTKTGEALKAAQDAGLPVKVTTRPKGDSVGEAYLDSCVAYKAPKAKLAPVPAPELPPLTDSDIPF